MIPEPLVIDREYEVLLRADLLGGRDDPTTRHLAARFHALTVRAGELIFRQGTVADALFIVLAGRVKLLQEMTGGRRRLIGLVGPGDGFGELPIIDDGPRSANAVAMTDGRVARLTKAALHGHLADDPQTVRNLLSMMIGRLTHANDILAGHTSRSVKLRITQLLLSLCDRFGQARNGCIFVHHGLTQCELAAMIGYSRETVNRALAELESDGWITVESKSITVRDMAALHDCATGCASLGVRRHYPIGDPDGFESRPNRNMPTNWNT